MEKATDLKRAILSLKDTGSDGFEGLIRQLLEEWTGQRFYLAKAGSQRGRDMSGTTYYGNTMVAECKHYASSTPLKIRDILGEITEAKIEIPDLDLWVLVTSRDVSDQIATALKKGGLTLGIEILIIDQPSNEIDTLQILCAEYQDVTLSFLKAKDIDTVKLSTELEQIRGNTRYITGKNRLQNILAGTDFGFDSVRCKEQERFYGVVGSINQSKVEFNQDVAIQDNSRPPPIKRSDLIQQIDTWWQDGIVRSPLFMLLGDDGSGKTWVVIQWLKRLLEETFPPLVILIPSSDVSLAFSKLHDLVSSILSTHLRYDKDYMERRIESWFSEKRSASRILLFLDGLNENPTSKWASLLMDATSNEWDGRVAIIATSRSEYWELTLRNRIGHISNTVITEGYNDSELEQVASFHNVNMSVIPQDIMPLLRKPRLCDLALRKLKALVDSGDLTLERILFEDYKDREERKLESPLSQKEFLELLATLSKKYREGNTSLSTMDVQQSLSTDITALHEALYGGILESSNNYSTPFKVKRDWLVLGLGLLLADDVFQNNPTSLEEGLNYVDQWLDPHADMDIKAQICGAAIFASLQREYLPVARQALLVRWIGARNPDLDIEQKIAAYVPHCLSDLLVVTEEFWKAHNNNGLAQDRISWAFQHNLHRISDKKEFINAIMRWMSLINRTGQLFDRKQDDNNGEQLAKEVAERAGKELAAGERFQYAGYEFDIVDDEGLLRLARFALYLLSGTAFSTFSEVFIRWALSRNIMGCAFEVREVSWVLRLSNDNLWPEMEHTLRQLADSKNIIQRQAAHIMLECIGNKEAMQLRDEKLSDVFPLPEITRDYQRDPCISPYSWTREDCLRCLEREEVPIRKLVTNTSRFAIDPSLEVPAQVINRFEEYTDSLPVDEWHSSFSQTGGDIVIKQAEPTLARWIPAKFATQLRHGIQRISERKDEGKRQLLIHLPELGQIVSLSERNQIEKILKEYRVELEGSETSSKGKGADRRAFAEIEGTLVQIMQISADEAVDYLLQRPMQATDLLLFVHWSCEVSVSKKDMLLNMLLSEQEYEKINRILWMLSNNSPHLQPEHSERLIELLKSDEKTTRSLALELAVSSKDKACIEHILTENNMKHYVHNEREIVWYTWMLAHYGQSFSVAELAKHLPLAYLSDVIEVRG